MGRERKRERERERKEWRVDKRKTETRHTQNLRKSCTVATRTKNEDGFWLAGALLVACNKRRVFEDENGEKNKG